MEAPTRDRLRSFRFMGRSIACFFKTMVPTLVVASIGSLPRFTRGEEKGTPYPAFACGGWLIESRTVP